VAIEAAPVSRAAFSSKVSWLRMVFIFGLLYIQYRKIGKNTYHFIYIISHFSNECKENSAERLNFHGVFNFFRLWRQEYIFDKRVTLCFHKALGRVSNKIAKMQSIFSISANLYL
jgi:hypothetical protein